MTKEEKKNYAIKLLKDKYTSLSRLPKKDDFDEKERSYIKAHLGPWPRALETAGLKSPKVKKGNSRR